MPWTRALASSRYSDPGVFTTVEGNPIWWEESPGLTHVCEGAEIMSGYRLVWTLCGQDVPPDATIHPPEGAVFTCPKCRTFAAAFDARSGRPPKV